MPQVQFAYEALVTEAPIGEVSALYEAWQTKALNTRRGYLAAVNFASYGGNFAFPEDGVTPAPFGTAAAPADEGTIAAAFQELLPDAEGTMKAGIGSAAFFLILKNVALPLLIELLKSR